MNAKQVLALRRSLPLSASERAQRKEEQAPSYPDVGLTRREAAGRVGVCMSTWYRWERGQPMSSAMAIMLDLIASRNGRRSP